MSLLNFGFSKRPRLDNEQQNDTSEKVHYTNDIQNLLYEIQQQTENKTVEPARKPGRPKRKAEDLEESIESPSSSSSSSSLPRSKSGRYVQWPKDLVDAAVDSVHKHGGDICSTIRFLKLNFPNQYDCLADSTLRGWCKKREDQVLEDNSRVHGPNTIVKGGLLETIKDVVLAQCNSGVEQNYTMLKPVVKAVINESSEYNILEENGGRFVISNSWLDSLLKGLNLSIRRGTTAAQKLPIDWENQLDTHLMRLSHLVREYNVPKSLVINLDQTGCHLVPCRGRTWAAKGSKEVPIIGLDDKRQITLVPSVALDGSVLPVQVIFQGKTERCLPAKSIRDLYSDWNFTYSENHWSNLGSMKLFINEVVRPYITKTVDNMGLSPNQKSVLILDCWKVHKSREFLEFMKESHPDILLLFVPAGCTGKIQLLDVAIQKPLKNAIRDGFTSWLQGQASNQLKDNVAPSKLKFDLRMSVLKPLLSGWIKKGVDHLTKEMVHNGMKKIGLDQCWSKEFQLKSRGVYESGKLWPNQESSFFVPEESEVDPTTTGTRDFEGIDN